MAIKISQFKTALNNIARPNRFLVDISAPAGLDFNSDMQFHCQATKIPDRSLGEIEVKMAGMSLKIPGDYTHDDLTLTFINNQDWKVRDFFEAWIASLHNVTRDENSHAEGFDAIRAPYITVKQLGDTEDKILAAYRFYSIFPKNITEIALAMDTFDSSETFDVTFAYSYQERVKL